MFEEAEWRLLAVGHVSRTVVRWLLERLWYSYTRCIVILDTLSLSMNRSSVLHIVSYRFSIDAIIYVFISEYILVNLVNIPTLCTHVKESTAQSPALQKPLNSN